MSVLGQRMSELVRACFTGIWIKSYEPDDAIAELTQLCRTENWSLMTWDIAQGLKSNGDQPTASDAIDPIGAVKALSAMTNDDIPTIMVLRSYHRFIGSGEIVAEVAKAITQGKVHRKFVVILSPVVQLPPELERLFVVVDHEPPTRDELRELLAGIATDGDEMPTGNMLESVLDAAVGLTRYEAENAFSLSLIRHGAVQPEAIWELKTQALKKSGLLSLCRSESDFSSLGGLSALKAFTKRALLRAGNAGSLAKPRGRFGYQDGREICRSGIHRHARCKPRASP